MQTVKPFRLDATTPFIWLLVIAAGLTDATLYLHSKDLLAVYVTGDTSKLGQALQQGDLQKALPLLGVIVAFLFGTTAGAWLGRRAGSWRSPLLLALVALLLAIAWLATAPHYPPLMVLVIAVAMGLLNQVRGSEPGVTFITGTLVRLGRALARGSWRSAGGLGLRWLAWLLAALAGAWLDSRLAAWAIAIIALYCLLLAAVVAANHLVIRERLQKRAAQHDAHS